MLAILVCQHQVFLSNPVTGDRVWCDGMTDGEDNLLFLFAPVDVNTSGTLLHECPQFSKVSCQQSFIVLHPDSFAGAATERQHHRAAPSAWKNIIDLECAAPVHAVVRPPMS